MKQLQPSDGHSLCNMKGLTDVTGYEVLVLCETLAKKKPIAMISSGFRKWFFDINSAEHVAQITKVLKKDIDCFHLVLKNANVITDFAHGCGSR